MPASTNKRQSRHRRLRKKVAGTSERPRLAVHFSGRHVTAQVIDDTAHKTLASVHTTESELRADSVVVCADALRTPQLLFASGIRPDALGRYLNEHAFVTGRVLLGPKGKTGYVSMPLSLFVTDAKREKIATDRLARHGGIAEDSHHVVAHLEGVAEG